MKYGLGLLLVLTAASPLPAQGLSFDDVFTKVEARFEPASAKPGDTVKWIFRVEIIPGWHTYPTKQPDPAAEPYVTQFHFNEMRDGIVSPAGDLKDPPNPIIGAEPALDIKHLVEYENGATWEQPMKVAAAATPGEKEITVPVTIYACKESCLPPNKIKTKAKLTIIGEARANGATMGTKSASPPDSASVPSTIVDDEPKGSSSHAAALDHVLSQLKKQKVDPNTGLGSFLMTAALWGLITLFTPCVFPMIPITVSFFLKQAEKQHANPLFLATVYCGTIVVVLGTAALTLLQFFTILSINPWMNVFLGALFVVLALSLFGMFDITLQMGLRAAIIGIPILALVLIKPAGPQILWVVLCGGVIIALLAGLNKYIERAAFALQQSTSAKSSVGGIIGTVFMAISFTIVSFTCVAPFLGGFGGMAASGQFQTWELILGAMAFAGTFAAPFFVLALFPTLLKKLPKSGGWLNTVKVVMGFLELAAALKFFRTAELVYSPQTTLFTFDLVLGMWIALSLLCGLYLINLFRIGHDEPIEAVSVPRLLLGFVFLSLALYLLPALFSMGADGEKMRPRGSVYAWVDSFLLPDTTDSKTQGELDWSGDLKAAIDAARNDMSRTGRQKYVFIDFTGKTCTNCKLNEREVFSKPDVGDLFKPYRLVQLYTDTVPNKYYPTAVASKFGNSTAQQQADAILNRQFQEKAFGSIQLPLYVILKPTVDGSIEVVDTYAEGKINNVPAFKEFLKRPLASTETARAAN